MRNTCSLKAAAVTFAAILAFAPALTVNPSASAANAQDVPDFVKQAIAQAFKTVSGIVVKNAEKINQWKNDAIEAGKKTVKDFTGCPSNAAQDLYNDLKNKRDSLTQVIADATAADQQAQQARATCKNSVPDNNAFKAACDAAYNNLPFVGIKTSAQTALNAVNPAITTLKGLKCVSGCDKTASLVFPTVSAQPGPTQPGPNITVCTEWEPGQFLFNSNAGNGELSASVTAKLPKCKKTQTFPLSTCEWNLGSILTNLKLLKIVPPEVNFGEVSLDIPKTTVQVLNGFTQGNCSQPLQVCTAVNTQANITFDLGTDPITNLKNAMQGVTSSCVQQTTVGCLNPPFGITPTYTSVQIADPTKAKITWTGKPGVKAGSVTVDLSKAQWNAFCTPRPVKIPGPPVIKVGKQVINFLFLCTQLKYANLVANQ